MYVEKLNMCLFYNKMHTLCLNCVYYTSMFSKINIILCPIIDTCKKQNYKYNYFIYFHKIYSFI